MSVLIGETVGSYRVIRQLGQGGMGAVYLAEHLAIGRKAALKLLLPELSTNADMVRRMFNEARAAALIDHPGLVDIYDFGIHSNNSAYLVMEFLDGESLATRLHREGQLPIGLAVALARQIAAAVGAAHDKGIIHRDLKPDNVFLVADSEIPCGFRARVLDFGIAKLSEGDNRYKTATGVLMGTPVYMSPEQCRGAGFTDHRSDIYALGCVLFEMLTGRPPFVKEGLGELIAAHQYEPAPAIATLAPDVPGTLQSLVAATLEKAVAKRPQTMKEVVDWLLKTPSQPATRPIVAKVGETLYLDSLSPVAHETPAPPSASRGSQQRRLALGRPLVVGGSVLAAVVATALLWPRGHGAPERPAPAPPVVIVNDQTSKTNQPGKTDQKDEKPPDKAVIETVKLEIASVPPGASVYLAATGALLGTAPLQHAAPVGPGEVAFLLKRDGYLDAQIALATARNGSAKVTLKRNPGAGGKSPKLGDGQANAGGKSPKPGGGHSKMTILDPFKP